jgi:thiamine-monophosphate kinase
VSTPAGPPPDGSGEFGLIAWFRARAERTAAVAFGIGDDCAGLRFTPGREVLITTDMLLDGRHFLSAEHTPEQIGRKAMGVNLSDIAAMAGVPLAAVVSVGLPLHHGSRSAEELARRLFHGLNGMARECGVALVGGDTNAWDGPLVVSVTVLGEATEKGPVRRSGARPGDVVLVTGRLGGSLASGRHLEPRPRISEALALHQAANLHAMIDVSDGLAADLNHILEESGNLGAVLSAMAIPVHPDAERAAAGDGRSPLDHALGDGEDFELCFTVGPDDANRLLAEPPARVTLYRIGDITPESGLRLAHPDGRVEPLEPMGFDHLGGDAERSAP